MIPTDNWLESLCVGTTAECDSAELLHGVPPQALPAGIDRYDLLKFSSFLRDEKKQSPRSVYNKFETVIAFLKANGIRGLVGKNGWPRCTEEEPEMYEQKELNKLFKA